MSNNAIASVFVSFFLFSNGLFAQDVASGGGAVAQPPAWMQFVPFIAIAAVFYFFIIMPQSKKQKETQNFLGSLKIGDQVVTNAGILGRITGMNEQIVTLEVASEVLIKVLRSQILMPQSALQAKKEGK